MPVMSVGNVFKSEGLHDFNAPPLVISEFVPYETPAEPGFVDEFFRLEACEHFFLLRCTESPFVQLLLDVGKTVFRAGTAGRSLVEGFLCGQFFHFLHRIIRSLS